MMTQITIFFFGVLAVLVTAMFIHDYLDKNKITKSLHRLTAHLSGSVLRDHPFDYPRFHSKQNGREFDFFFNVVKVGRQHILYSIYSLTAALPQSLLLIKKETYKPITDDTHFTALNGTLFETDIPFLGRSSQPEWAKRACNQAGFAESIGDLDSFSSLQCGPDALVIGKPYEGDSDIDPENIVRQMGQLEKLAVIMEQCPA